MRDLIKVRLPISVTTAFLLEHPDAATLVAGRCKPEVLEEVYTETAKLLDQIFSIRSQISAAVDESDKVEAVEAYLAAKDEFLQEFK